MSAAVNALAALAVGVAVFAAAPAEARLSDPGVGSVIGGGLFGGVRLGPRSAALPQPNARPASELAGENCYLLRERVVTPRGGVAVARLQVCE